MSGLRAFAVYDTTLSEELVAERRHDIKAHCKKQTIPSPNFDTPDFFEATVTASELAQNGHQVVLVGSLNDLHIPSPEIMNYNVGAFTEHEWREAWLAYLKDRALGWSPTDPTTAAIPQDSANRQSIIRSYQRSCVGIARFLARLRSRRKVGTRSKEPGYVYGRPPYGYRVVKGHLEPDGERINLVRTAFECLREGMTVTDAALALQALDMGRDGKKEFWDPVKIRRILKHASLYCLGEYTSPTGKVVRLPSLAILPRTWVRVAADRMPQPVPKSVDSGTMGALEPSTLGSP